MEVQTRRVIAAAELARDADADLSCARCRAVRSACREHRRRAALERREPWALELLDVELSRELSRANRQLERAQRLGAPVSRELGHG